MATSGCLSPSVYEKGEDLVIQELATRPLTQDLLHEEVRQVWPQPPCVPTHHTTPPSLDYLLTRLALAPRTVTS